MPKSHNLENSPWIAQIERFEKTCNHDLQSSIMKTFQKHSITALFSNTG